MMTIEFNDKRRKPLIIDFEEAVTHDEVMAELWLNRIKLIVLFLSRFGLLTRFRAYKRRVH